MLLKRKFTVVKIIIALVFILSLVLVMPVLAQGETPGEIPGLALTAEQLVLVGLIATAATTVFRFIIDLLAKRQVQFPDWILQLVVVLIAGIAAFLWFPPTLPLWPDFTGLEIGDQILLFLDGFAAPLFTVLAAWFVSAHLLYKWFVKRIRDGLSAQFKLPK